MVSFDHVITYVHTYMHTAISGHKTPTGLSEEDDAMWSALTNGGRRDSDDELRQFNAYGKPLTPRAENRLRMQGSRCVYI